LFTSNLMRVTTSALLSLSPAASYLLPNDSGNAAEQACS